MKSKEALNQTASLCRNDRVRPQWSEGVSAASYCGKISCLVGNNDDCTLFDIVNITSRPGLQNDTFHVWRFAGSGKTAFHLSKLAWWVEPCTAKNRLFLGAPSRVMHSLAPRSLLQRVVRKPVWRSSSRCFRVKRMTKIAIRRSSRWPISFELSPWARAQASATVTCDRLLPN